METGESVAIKKVLQDRRYKNRELQLMRLMDHPNVVSLKHCFFSTTSRDELFLNLVMEYVPETLYRVLKHYTSSSQRMPIFYVKLYTYQVCIVIYLFPFQAVSLFVDSKTGKNTFFSADLQRLGLYPYCSWCLSQRCETTKSFGMLILFWVCLRRSLLDCNLIIWYVL